MVCRLWSSALSVVACNGRETMVKITRRALLSALTGAKNTYPNEFIALFDGVGDELTDLVIPPLAQSNGRSASYTPWFLPATSLGLASFHSHPSKSNKPSQTDLLHFSKRQAWHFIACYPYRVEDVAAYDNKGNRIEFEIV